MPVRPEQIPTELKDLRRWACWSWTWKGGKWDKPPAQPGGRPACVNDPKTWSTFDEALAAYRRGDCDGIGIVLGNIPGQHRVLAGMDLDDVRDPETGELDPWASWAVSRLDTYTEVSPSRNGVKALGWGELPKGKGRERRADHQRGVEMYDRGRYFCVTGHRLDGVPDSVMERYEALAGLHAELLGHPGGQPAGPGQRDDVALAREALARLSTARAVGYSDWLGVGMALHSVSDALVGDWDSWSRSCQDKYAEGVCAAKWRSFKAGGGVTLGSLLHWARQDIGWRPEGAPCDSAHGEQAHQGNGKATAGGSAGLTFEVGSVLRLRVRSGRRTGSDNLVADLGLLCDGRPDRFLKVTGSASNQEAAARALLCYPGVDRDAAREAIGQALAAADLLAKRTPGGPGGPGIPEVVSRFVREELALRFRVKDKAWSERLGYEVSRYELTRWTPRSLLEAAAAAAGPMTDAQLMGAVKRALEVEWATVVPALPEEADAADCGPDSKAARRWKHALVSLLTAPLTFDARRPVEGTGEEAGTPRATLMSRLRSQVGSVGDWRSVHPAFDLFWRQAPEADDRLVGLRWTLVEQVRFQHRVVTLPGVTGEESLARIGVRYGCLMADPPVPAELSGGYRLAVLSAEVLAEAGAAPKGPGGR
jgi:hypothetical protein